MRENRQDNRLFVKAVFLMIVMVLQAGILMYLAWCSYEEKMEILYVTLEQQSGGIAPVDIVTGLLKGQIVTDVSDAQQHLERYGFHESFENYYKKSLYRSWTVISVIFCLLYAGILALLEILQSGGLSETEYQEFLERCRIQILRLEELVAALVNISRMETGMIAIKKVERNLFDTILLAVKRIYPKSEEKGISIELEAEEELRQVKVLHDPKWLCEAFLNVLENAVKYSADQTKITIRMIRMNVYLRIEIEDEGIGIPGKEWNRIFQRFYRGGAREVQEASGSGLGRYLAREIVTRHEGTLVVSALRHQKQGSCFVFQIPCL